MTHHTSILLVSILSSVLLSARAGTPSQTAKDYRPETEARVRVYWGANVTFYLNTACVTGEADAPVKDLSGPTCAGRT